MRRPRAVVIIEGDGSSEDGEDRPHELAYEASVRAIEDQAGVLESLRARAGTVFVASALVMSFLGGQALSRATDHGLPEVLTAWSFAGAAIGVFVVLALLTLITLLPFRMRFSLSARDMLAIYDDRAANARPVTSREALREVALRHEAMYDYNAKRIRILLWCFRAAILCLVGDVALWIVVLWRRRI